MDHSKVLETNIEAVRASLARLQSRDDLTDAEKLKVVEIEVIYNSLVKTLEEWS